MAGIYIHIPFCKQACFYCDFHFSTSMVKKGEMIIALQHELKLRKEELKDDLVETIYFGGGTPSVLASHEIEAIIESVYQHYRVSKNPEITLEANPDDLSRNRILELAKSPVNRLSIGVQSFFEEDLKLMNRAHSAIEAEASLSFATQHFDNISIDLIYGIPGATDAQWLQNIEKALSFGISHISSYALTVEPKTALAHMIEKGEVANIDEEAAERQFHLLIEVLNTKEFVHYEISNFGKEGYFSKNNTAYWQGKKYVGIGPSAHSFDGKQRGWNVKNNTKYLKSIQSNKVPIEIEVLTIADRYNEYVMTGLRTIWGVSIEKIAKEFGEEYSNYLIKGSSKAIAQRLLIIENGVLKVTQKGKFLADGLAADLFMV
ncbi:radical SAM family heme chaperone HemW [Aurantibacter sp.]|uniref:radical SAM family heme chaperone HemW n=1 Tax=Aurantibacter sp. TaxID=2807103 RepID=UPI003265ACB4